MKTSLKRCALAIIMCGVFLQTKAEVKELPFYEDFSTFGSITYASTACNGWTLFRCYHTVTNATNTCLYFGDYVTTSNPKRISSATSPALNLDGNAKLSFKVRATSNGKIAKLILSITNGMFNDGTKSININDIPYAANSYKTYEYCIIGTGETKIKFLLNSNIYLAIDDVSVTIDAGTSININDGTDNSDILETNNDKIVNVATSRTLVGGIWNTLCLPFNVSQATMEAALGTGQDIQMRTYSSYADGVMNFTPVADTDIIEAGTPFLLKLNTTVTNPTFTSVTVSDTPAKTINHDGVCFVGTYSQKDLSADGTDVFITTSGSLAIPTADGTTMKGMRAHVTVPESMKFTIDGVRLAIDHDETTAIRPTAGEQQSGTIYYYDLNGQRLQQPRKGLNIVRSAEAHQQGKNGKLTFIR